MDTHIEVYNVARVTNVFAQQLGLWSSSSHVGGVRVRVPFMTVTPNYLNGLVDKAGCMDTHIEVYNVARVTNVFAQQSELWSSRSMG